MSTQSMELLRDKKSGKIMITRYDKDFNKIGEDFYDQKEAEMILKMLQDIYGNSRTFTYTSMEE